MQGIYLSWLNCHEKFQEKVTLVWGIWQILTTWKCQNRYFGILLSKVENAWAKTYRGVMSNGTAKWWKIWRGIDLSFQNGHEGFNEFWPEHSKIPKICTLMGCLWPKYIMLALKGVRFDGTKYWCKIWKKIDLCFQKWHEKFGKFSPEHSKALKLGLWWDPFIQRTICMSLKFTGELHVMTMKNDRKFKEELTCQFKTDIRNLINFDPSIWKSKKYAL